MTRKHMWAPLGAAVVLICLIGPLRGNAMRRAAAGGAGGLAETLRRQTQEMFDALVPGGAAVWARYLDADFVLTSEDGTVMNRAQLLKQTVPMGPGITGTIKVIDFKVIPRGTTAVATHVEDEHETYHGHALHCQYRTTDTWVQTAAGWRLLASQVLALRTDPPAIPLAARQMQEYCGTYSLTPAVHYEIRCAGGALEGRQTGHKPEALRAEAPDVLFALGRPRYRSIFHRGADGRITGFAERREAWSLEWTRDK
jgi:hypothetical protein